MAKKAISLMFVVFIMKLVISCCVGSTRTPKSYDVDYTGVEITLFDTLSDTKINSLEIDKDDLAIRVDIRVDFMLVTSLFEFSSAYACDDDGPYMDTYNYKEQITSLNVYQINENNEEIKISDQLRIRYNNQTISAFLQEHNEANNKFHSLYMIFEDSTILGEKVKFKAVFTTDKGNSFEAETDFISII